MLTKLTIWKWGGGLANADLLTQGGGAVWKLLNSPLQQNVKVKMGFEYYITYHYILFEISQISNYILDIFSLLDARCRKGSLNGQEGKIIWTFIIPYVD